MSDFVEQCRREWRRLGVGDSIADEMAADLSSDLEEARAEGVSVEELLGSSYSDPRAFAASWAAERGILPEGHGGAGGRRPLALLAFTVLAALALVVAALLLASGEPRVGIATSGTPPPNARVLAPRPGHLVRASAAAPVEWILLVVALAALGFAGWLWSGRRRTRPSSVAA